MRDGKVEVGDVLRGDRVVAVTAAAMAPGDREVCDVLRPEHLGPLTDEYWWRAQRIERCALHGGLPHRLRRE